jgi:hypothetical protein
LIKDDLAMTQTHRLARNLLATVAALGIFAAALPASAAPISLTALGDDYEQNFNSLAGTGGSNPDTTLPAGWTFFEAGTGADVNYAADNGLTSTLNTYSYGTIGSTERGIGTLQDSEFSAMFGAEFKNQTGEPITALQISYRGEVWRLGTLALLDRLDFQYSTNAVNIVAGTWNNFDPLDFSAGFLTGQSVAIGKVSGNSSPYNALVSSTITGLNVDDGETFWIRWLDNAMTAADDDGLAIDQFSITSVSVPEPASLALAAGAAIVGIAATTRRKKRARLAA